jgi:hypothetical protein
MKAQITGFSPLWILVVALAISGVATLVSGSVLLAVSQLCMAGYLGFLAQKRLRN